MPRPQRDPILAGVQAGNYPDHSDAWAPFAYEAPARLWDYLPPSTQILWNDELSCQQDWDEFLETQKRLAGDALQSGVVGAPVPELFAWTPELDKGVRHQTRLYLDRLEMADVESVGSDTETDTATDIDPEEKISARHRVFIRNNTDLGAGSKHALGELEPKIKLWLRQGFKILTLASTQSQLERIRFLLEERGFVCHLEPGLQPSVVSPRDRFRLARLSVARRRPGRRHRKRDPGRTSRQKATTPVHRRKRIGSQKLVGPSGSLRPGRRRRRRAHRPRHRPLPGTRSS